jgi:CDP-paratose 2-epimerase
MKCTMEGRPYSVFGYQGKQVRDAIHSSDLVSAFEHFWRAPRVAEVYNIGGGRHSHCSMREAIAMCQDITGRELEWTYVDENRMGDHIWYVGSNARFEGHFPEWRQSYDVPRILTEMHEANAERWA